MDKTQWPRNSQYQPYPHVILTVYQLYLHCNSMLFLHIIFIKIFYRFRGWKYIFFLHNRWPQTFYWEISTFSEIWILKTKRLYIGKTFIKKFFYSKGDLYIIFKSFKSSYFKTNFDIYSLSIDWICITFPKEFSCLLFFTLT